MKQSFLINVVIAIFSTLSITTTQAQDVAAHQGYTTVVNNKFETVSKPSFDMKVKADSTGQRFKVTVLNPKKKKLQLSIYHTVTGYVYSQAVDEEYLCKYFNLSEADDGIYKVEIRNGRERLAQKINVNTYTEVSRKIELN